MITISAGNAAAAVAYGCALEEIDCLVVMWQGTSELKAAAAHGLRRGGGSRGPRPGRGVRAARGASCRDRARVRPSVRRSSRHRRPLQPEPRDPGGRPETDVIVAGVGGGGLVSGVAVGAPGTRVVGVEPEGSAALRDGLAAGHPVLVRPDSIADALNAPIAGEHCLAVCRERGVESLLVSEDDIRAGFRFLYERAKLAAEPGAAAGGGRAPGRQGARCRGEDGGRCRLGRQRGRQNRCCYPEFK